jgi:uncharacterized membrane protein
MGKKDKKAASTFDVCTKVCFALGGVLCLGTLVPAVPWRYSRINAGFGARFAVERSMSLVTVTDNQRAGKTWMQMSKKVCNKMEQMQKGAPLAALGGMLMNTASTSMGMSKYTGGAMVGCTGWDLCKAHLTTRCFAYRTIAYGGLACMFMQLVGVVCAFVTPVMMGNEMQSKKKKKQEQAKLNTMTCGITAFVFPFLATTIWYFLTDSKMKELQSTAMYPFAAAHAGLYMALVGVLLLFAGFCSVIYRVYGGKAKEGESDEEDEQEYAVPGGADAPPPGMEGEGAPPPPGM